MIKVFNKVKSTLQSLQEIEHVGLFKNEYRLIPSDDPLPFLCPAAFIGFQNVRYLPNADKTQTGEGIVRIYLALELSSTLSDEDFLALREVVHKALQGLRDEDHFSSLNRVAENTDPEFEALSVWLLDYEVSWSDNSARPAYIETLADLKVTRT